MDPPPDPDQGDSNLVGKFELQKKFLKNCTGANKPNESVGLKRPSPVASWTGGGSATVCSLTPRQTSWPLRMKRMDLRLERRTRQPSSSNTIWKPLLLQLLTTMTLHGCLDQSAEGFLYLRTFPVRLASLCKHAESFRVCCSRALSSESRVSLLGG